MYYSRRLLTIGTMVQGVKEKDAFITTRTRTKRRRETKKGVEVLVQWKDGSKTWMTLKYINNSYPVLMA